MKNVLRGGELEGALCLSLLGLSQELTVVLRLLFIVMVWIPSNNTQIVLISAMSHIKTK